MKIKKTVTIDIGREYLDRLLKVCTAEQLGMFNRMYPNGPAPKQIKWAITQIENTILSMNKKAQVLANIQAEFEEFKRVNSAITESLQLSFNNLAQELNEADKEIERLSTPETIASADVLRRLYELAALEAAGVDNWEWYDKAMSNVL
jgi:thiamine biosynthesis lipoprotein ApbE